MPSARWPRRLLAAAAVRPSAILLVIRWRSGGTSGGTDASLSLQCPYCSNPLELERANVELTAEEWGEAFRSAAAIGAMQLHLSGGEPTLRRDLEILAYAVEAGLYTNLVTSAVMLTRERLETLAKIGLDHVQVSIQDVVPEIRRPHQRVRGRRRQEARCRAVDARTWHGPYHQCADASAEHRSSAADHRFRGRGGSPAHRGRSYPILRLGERTARR